jgi:hypothetical protein
MLINLCLDDRDSNWESELNSSIANDEDIVFLDDD